MKGGCMALNEDTLGTLVKSGIAQFVALEITRSNGHGSRAVGLERYLPWLYKPPLTTQQGYGYISLKCLSKVLKMGSFSLMAIIYLLLYLTPYAVFFSSALWEDSSWL
ncbi:hypothetical protein DPMN_036333 [Dreissena polymorpha]|uniref:Uncharacterized protein n=1 Tax=Dreissena polymorpha TaxID=45954 RepID=A0A9D4RNQ9_DREPO|nr:hypothetical protein DPMN_036333 [Dreissena polymorpha]